MVPSITLAIISCRYLVKIGLAKIFESTEAVRIVMHSHLKMALDGLLAENRPDVFLLDMETERDAVGTIGQIRASAPKSKIVLLSRFEDAHRTHEAFECGVDGVILNVQPPAVVLAAIEALHILAANHAFVGSHDVGGVNLSAASNAQPSAWPEGLTERKREIIRLVGQGLSNKDIADRLCISDSTVRHHLTGIFEKVGVSNRQKLLIHTRHVRPSLI